MGKPAKDAQQRPTIEPADGAGIEDSVIPGLTEEQARIILKSDLANIVRKVKAGKTLSASERALLATARAGGKPTSARFVSTRAELAEAIGVSRRSVARWLKLPGNPKAQPDGRYEVAEGWQQGGNQVGSEECQLAPEVMMHSPP